jgi:GH24 family phage-related lysozyme (muramidase)/peptidoglycan hydrolase-like protein with peptidoglycan-binding domain
MTEASQRQAWKAFDGNESQMIDIAFGPDRLKVARPTEEAWQALHAVLQAHDYEIRPDETHGYAQRNIKGTSTKSLHAFGLAIDINAPTNPMRETPDRRKVRFSDKPTQRERARDVVLHEADTDMTPAMIADILAIKTKNGKQAFGWGGNWNTRKDTMHFYVDVPPQDLETGIDWTTVKADRQGGPATSDRRRYEDWEERNPEWTLAEGTAMKTSQSGRDFLRAQEGERLTAYQDSVGVWTIGVGHTTAAGPPQVQPGMRISKEQSDEILSRDLASFETAVSEAVRVPLNQNEFDALVSLCFNIGPGRFASSSVVRELNAGNRRAAADAFLMWNKARGRVLDGLTSRRQRERALFLTPVTGADEWDGADQQTWARPSGIPQELWDILIKTLDNSIPRSQAQDGLTLQFGDEGTPVRELQKRLTELDYHTGGIDGIFGTLTRRAVAAFQVENQLHGTGIADAATRTAIMGSQASRFAPGRESATASDLRQMGSREVVNADRVRYASWGTGALGAVGMGQNVFGSGSLENALRAFIANKDQLSKVFGPDFSPAAVTKAQDYLTSNAASAKIGPIADVVMPLISGLVPGGLAGSLLALALGVGGHVLGSNIIDRRVQLQRDGRHIGAVGL